MTASTQQFYSPGLTRSHGDAGGVVNMDIGIDDQSFNSSLGTIISTGVGKEIGAFKIIVQTASQAAIVPLNGTQTYDLYTGAPLVTGASTGPGNNALASQMQPGGAVEAILKVIAQKVTILAYQVDSGTTGQINVIFEQTAAWSAFNYGTNGVNPTNDYGSTVASLQSAIQLLGTVGYTVTYQGTTTAHTVDVSGTQVYNAGQSGSQTTAQFGSSITFA